MEDQGIMALPQAGMPAPAQEGSPQAQAAVAAFDQARVQMDPKEFGDELLGAAEQADPAAVQEFRQALDQLNLPPEVLDALGQMVDIIMSQPQNYADLRQEFVASGVPEEILPEQFDAMYFSAMNLALDQLNAKIPVQPMAQGFAKGGIAQLKPVAAGIASMGRGTDTMLAHITPSEARMLRRYGGSGTTNPYTGLREYGIGSSLKKAVKSVGNAVSSVGKAIGSAVKSVASVVKKFTSSTVGRVVTAVALGFFLGPAAASLMGVSSAAGVAAISGFIGSAGTTLLSGGNLKQAIKNGVVGGVTAGAMAGVTQGMNAFQTGSYTGPTTISGQVDRFTEGLRSLAGTSAPTSELSSSTLDYSGAPENVTQGMNPSVPPPTVPAPTLPEPLSYQPSFGEGVQVAGPATSTSAFAPQASPFEQSFYDQGQSFNDAIGVSNTSPFASSPSNVAIERNALGMTGPLDTARQYIGEPTADIYDKYISPSRNAPSPTALQDRANELMTNIPGLSADRATAIASQELAKSAPGFFSSYGPMVATGMGAAYLGGAFDPKQEPPPGIVPRTTGFDLYNQNPAEYGVTPGGANMTYASSNINPGEGSTSYFGSSTGYGILGAPMNAPRFQVRDPRQYLYGTSGGIAAMAPRRYNMGGFAQGGGIRSLAQRYPRRNGAISGPGTETSDDIPAMLSDGEFVMTAAAVRGAGGGSRREGAKRMYQMMRKFERKA